jgi:hypothetical protein
MISMILERISFAKIFECRIFSPKSPFSNPAFTIGEGRRGRAGQL